MMQNQTKPKMREYERITEVLDTLGKAWRLYPDLRLMQFLASVVDTVEDPFYLEDNNLKKKLREFIVDNEHIERHNCLKYLSDFHNESLEETEDYFKEASTYSLQRLVHEIKSEEDRNELFCLGYL